MGGCTLIVTLSMCITFSIRRKTWLTLHCSIKQLCISVQSLLICNVFIVSLSFPPPLSLRLSYLTSYALEEEGIQLLMISAYHSLMLSFLHTTTSERSKHISKLLAGNIISSCYHSQNVNSSSNSLIMENKNNTVVKQILRASQPLYLIPFTLSAITSVH